MKKVKWFYLPIIVLVILLSILMLYWRQNFNTSQVKGESIVPTSTVINTTTAPSIRSTTPIITSTFTQISPTSIVKVAKQTSPSQAPTAIQLSNTAIPTTKPTCTDATLTQLQNSVNGINNSLSLAKSEKDFALQACYNSDYSYDQCYNSCYSQCYRFGGCSYDCKTSCGYYTTRSTCDNQFGSSTNPYNVKINKLTQELNNAQKELNNCLANR